MGHWQLSQHVSAKIQSLAKRGRYEAAYAVRDVAITVAIEIYGADVTGAVKWLRTCYVWDAERHYTNALDQIRLRAAAMEAK